VNGPCYYDYSMGYVEVDQGEKVCDSPYLIPGSYMMNQRVLTFGVFIVLLWLFMGIGVISDIFMEAIETICAQTKVVEIDG